jgi:hypothetical protein
MDSGISCLKSSSLQDPFQNTMQALETILLLMAAKHKSACLGHSMFRIIQFFVAHLTVTLRDRRNDEQKAEKLSRTKQDKRVLRENAIKEQKQQTGPNKSVA